MHPQDARVAYPPGAQSDHVSFRKLLYGIATHLPHEPGRERKRHRKRRHEDPSEIARCHNAEEAQADREDVEKEERHEKGRKRVEEVRDGLHGLVEDAAFSARADQSQRNRYDKRQRHRSERESDGVGYGIEEHLDDRCLRPIRRAQIALQHISDPGKVLHVEGLVEAEFRAFRSELLGCRRYPDAAERANRGIGRREVGQGKGDHADEEHDQDRSQCRRRESMQGARPRPAFLMSTHGNLIQTLARQDFCASMAKSGDVL